MPAMIWTKPYFGISHLGKLGDIRRATVREICEGVVELDKWVQGCGFSPEVVRFEFVSDAKGAGERWVEYGV